MYKCEKCDKEFDNHRMLNGHKSVHREGGRYSVSRKIKTETKACLYCQTPTNNDKFCSIKCQAPYEWNDRFLRIKSGEILAEHHMKRYLMETRGYKCESCGVGEVWNNKPLTLQMDHVDGNSDNNSLENLQILCPNCHTQTSTWCGRNTKNSKRNKYLRKYKTEKMKVLNSVGRVHSLHG